MNECFCVCVYVSVSATYIHFTLVNHIEVVSFIAWREKQKRKAGVCEREQEKSRKST